MTHNHSFFAIFNVMNRLIFLLTVVLLTSVFGDTSRRSLAAAEEAMLDCPERSLAILQTIPANNLPHSQRALYALLLSEALDKNYIDVTSDSLIRVAVDYYENTSDHRRRMRAYYCEGVVLRHAQDYPSATLFLEKANKEAQGLQDFFYMGQINRALGNIMNETNNNDESIRYIKKSIDYYYLAGKPIHEQYQWLALAISYTNDRQYSNGLRLLDSLLLVYDSPSYTGQCELLKAEILIETKCNDYSVPVNIYKNTDKRLFYITDFGYYALALEKMGIRDSSDVYLQRAYSDSHDEADSATVRAFQARIEKNRKNYRLAYDLLNNACNVQDSLTRVFLTQSVSIAQRNFFDKEAQHLEQRAQNQRLKYWLIISILLLIVFICGALVFFIIKKKDAMLKEQMALLALEHKRNALILGELFSERIGGLDMLADEYYAATTKEEKEYVFKQYKQRCTDLRNNNQLFMQLESDLDKYCDGIMKKLHKEVPQIRNNHSREIALMLSGLPTVVVQVLMDKPSLKAVEMDRSRYRKLIREANAEHASLFLNMLEVKSPAPPSSPSAGQGPGRV